MGLKIRRRDVNNFMNNYHEHRGYSYDWQEIRRVICYNDYHVFNNWIKQLEFIRVENHCVTLKARSDFCKAEVISRCSKLLLGLWQKENADILAVDILTAQEIFDFNN